MKKRTFFLLLLCLASFATYSQETKLSGVATYKLNGVKLINSSQAAVLQKRISPNFPPPEEEHQGIYQQIGGILIKLTVHNRPDGEKLLPTLKRFSDMSKRSSSYLKTINGNKLLISYYLSENFGSINFSVIDPNRKSMIDGRFLFVPQDKKLAHNAVDELLATLTFSK